jgi:hypothetical protein
MNKITFVVALIFTVTQANGWWPFTKKNSPQACENSFVSAYEMSFLKLLAGDREFFNTSRKYENYNSELSPEYLSKDSFENTLQSLPEGAIYFDSGSGETKAVSSLVKSDEFKHISKFVALSYLYPKIDDSILSAKKTSGDRFEFLHGKTLEEFYSQGTFKKYLQQIDFITDLHGPIEYSIDLRQVTEIYLSLLKKNGKVRFSFSNIRNRLVAIVDQRPRAIDWLNYFKAIKGISAVKIGEDPEGFNYLIELTKTEDHFELPKLEMIDYRTHFKGQPHRIYYFRDYTPTHH